MAASKSSEKVTLKDFLGVDAPPEQEPQAPSAKTLLSCNNVKDFCKGILESQEYRQSVVDRVSLGTLAPAVECRIYDYAYGKPVERVEFSDKSDPLDELTAEQLEDRARQLLDVARSLKVRDKLKEGDTKSVH